MASNTFYATSGTNSSVSGLLNGGEDSWGRSATTSIKTIDLGYFTYNMSSIRSTIPKVATISSVKFSIQIRQSRSSTSLYQTSIESQLFVGSTAKSSNNVSGTVGNSYATKSYTNSSTITSAELHSQNLRVHYIARYKGTLNTDQYAKDLKCIIDWSPINTTALSINKTSTTLNKGATETLTVTRTPSSVSYPTITWTSSNTSVATVDGNGKVTAKANGTATITAKTTDGTNLSKTCTVTVTTPVTGVTVSPTTLTLNVGGTYTLSKTVSPSDASNKNVTWSTSNTGIATVDSNGKVTAVGKGTCTITCTSSYSSSYKGTCSVTVNQQATGISIVPTSKQISLGTPKTNIFDYSKWVANGVNADGAYVSFNNYGFTLTSTRNDSFTNGYHMGANATDAQKTIVDKYGFSVTAGKTYTFAADVNQNSANDSELFVFWYNANKGYISHNSEKITGSGTLIYNKQAPSGAVYACIRLDNNVSGYTNLYTNIRVQENDSDVAAVGQCYVYAKVLPYNVNNENYTLSSSNTGVATVSNNGLITAVSAGTTTITATSTDGSHKASCTITVASPNIFKIANGSIIIENMILGTTNIKSAYIGSKQIFKKS
jgi:uncharacterized protein YjdB